MRTSAIHRYILQSKRDENRENVLFSMGCSIPHQKVDKTPSWSKCSLVSYRGHCVSIEQSRANITRQNRTYAKTYLKN